MHMLNAHNNSANLKKARLIIVVYVVVGSSSCGLILITSLWDARTKEQPHLLTSMSAGRRGCYGNNAQACMQHKNENTPRKKNSRKSVRPLQVIAAVRQFFDHKTPSE
jgi:hypothetical protein